MSKREIFIKCEVCERDKKVSEYYVSDNPYHEYGCITICKKCARNMIDGNNVETLKSFLKKVDRPFLLDMWESAKNGKRDTVPAYFTNIGMANNRSLGWEDSEGIDDSLKIHYKERIQTEEDIAVAKKEEKKSELEEELDKIGMTEEKLEERKAFWGDGYDPIEYKNFQRKYDSLIDTYHNKTAFVIEGLQTYVVYKCKAEMETARGNIDDAKEWSKLAITQGDKAKINLNAIKDGDESGSLGNFSELSKKVEELVDIIPILPKFIERPQDKIDIGIHCFVNYERRLSGMPDVEHDEIYEFYQRNVQDYLDDSTKSPEIKKHIIKKKITRRDGTTKEILFYDVYAVIDDLKAKHKDDKFIQNLDKWMEIVSWGRWFPDLWYDLISPETGKIFLDCDQRMVMRSLARFKYVYCVFPRGWSKTLLELMHGFHTCILYPNMEIAMTAQTMENAASLVESKWREVLRFFPSIENELKGKPLISKEKAIINFKSGGYIDTLQNGQSSKGEYVLAPYVEKSA